MGTTNKHRTCDRIPPDITIVGQLYIAFFFYHHNCTKINYVLNYVWIFIKRICSNNIE